MNTLTRRHFVRATASAALAFPALRLGAAGSNQDIRLAVIGLGPGAPEQMTDEARSTLAQASDLFGYGPYVERIALAPGQRRHASDNREELTRAHAALELAAKEPA